MRLLKFFRAQSRAVTVKSATAESFAVQLRVIVNYGKSSGLA